MHIERALEIIESLAAGVDPATGECFPQTSPYQSPETIRALCHVLEPLRATAKRERRREKLPRNAGMPWDPATDNELVARYTSGSSIADLAKHLGRTEGSVTARLIKMELIDPPAFKPRFGKGTAAALTDGEVKKRGTISDPSQASLSPHRDE